MADFTKDYYSPNREMYRNAAASLYDEAVKPGQAATDQYITDMSAVYKQAADDMYRAVDQQKRQLPQDYQYAYDKNAIQQAINEREVSDHMQQMGLTDSGLNRSQQMAINLQRSNADHAVTQQKNAQVNALQSALVQYLTKNEQDRLAAANQAKLNQAQWATDLWANMMQNADNQASSVAASLYSADQQRAAAEAKAKADAIAAQNQAALKQYELGLKYGIGKDGSGMTAKDISDLAWKMTSNDAENHKIPDGQSLNDIYKSYYASISNQYGADGKAQSPAYGKVRDKVFDVFRNVRPQNPTKLKEYLLNMDDKIDEILKAQIQLGNITGEEADQIIRELSLL